jgi:hypothetical protein
MTEEVVVLFLLPNSISPKSPPNQIPLNSVELPYQFVVMLNLIVDILMDVPLKPRHKRVT